MDIVSAMFFRVAEFSSLFTTPIPTKVTSSDFMYGSWYDARDYCASRNNSLFTLKRSFSKQLQDIVNSEDLAHGWQNTREYFFAGLHRNDEVGGRY